MLYKIKGDSASVHSASPIAKDVVLPATFQYDGSTCTVDAIGYGAFANNKVIEPITISDNITRIHDYAFYECINLVEVKFGKQSRLKFVYDAVFRGCSSLTDINLPNTLVIIGEYMFQDCSSLVDITLPRSIISIKECMFYRCTSLTTISMPSITSIEPGAFVECTGLEVLYLSNRVVKIDKSAFICVIM